MVTLKVLIVVAKSGNLTINIDACKVLNSIDAVTGTKKCLVSRFEYSVIICVCGN